MRTEKRKPIVAALLSIIVPGLGQMYNTQLVKGLLFYFIISVLAILLRLTGLQLHFYGMIVFLSLGILSYFLVAGEALFTAKRLETISLRAYNKWYYYLLFVIIAVATDTVTSDIVKPSVESCKIESGTMMPTLLRGDHVIVNTRYYDKADPNKGDVILFRYPNDPARHVIKRIVATENDVLESRDKVIYLNGLMLREPYVQHDDNRIEPRDNSPRDNFGPITIPKGKVFVMGDYRDQSYDSRFWGPIDKTQIIGKVIYIWWSKNRNRIGLEIN